ncbi:MAG: helix-turn-helix domain-containing protein [Candidatus Latescibacteria bacterium]|nr:helix-turn-helix domain-containing protein [Candidatus Latescibacterota bacterium]NIT03299.1 helix-turn-helix domain-containing protein [Candidatus Latescibacterota bacterium]
MQYQTNTPKLLTLSQASQILQVSKRTLHRMIQQKEIPAFKVGGQWRIRESQLNKWVEDKEHLNFETG